MPTLEMVLEQVKDKIRKYGKDAHCGQLVVMEEVRAKAIKNEADEEGRRRTRIGLQTYSPEAYSAWNQTIEYLMLRCGHNPLLVVDLLLLLVQEARQQTEGEGVDGLEIAKGMLFKMADYEEKLRIAKADFRARKKR
jgi:hypothetical protein